MAPALTQLGEVSIRQKRYSEAKRWLRDALDHEPGDALVRVDLAVALRLAGDTAGARKALDAALEAMPLFPFALAESWLVREGENRPAADGETPAPSWSESVPPDAEFDLEVAAWYLRLGDLDSARRVLVAGRDRLPADAQSPLLDYYLADIAREQGQTDQAGRLAALGAREPAADVFPDRLEDEVVLADAASRHPEDARAASLLGTFLFAHGRYEEAARLWRQAIGQGLKDAVVERDLGVFDWRVKGDLQSAAGAYEAAIKLAPDQYRLYPELDEIYSELGDFGRRTRLFAGAPATVLDHDVVRVRRTLLLVEQGQSDRALAMLARHQFIPWEGGEIVREMFVLANLEKGRSALRSGSPREAEQEFRTALEYPENLGVGKPDHPADAQALYWLGEALSAQEKTDAARAVWQQAAEESAGSGPTTRAYRAAALLRLGRNNDARRLTADVLASAAPKGAGATEVYAAGLAQDLTGNQAQARLEFQRALEIDPSYWQARVELERLAAGHRSP